MKRRVVKKVAMKKAVIKREVMKIFFGCFSIIAFLTLLVFSNFSGNAISLFADAGYFIPKHSSIFTFKSTLYNSGSGEYWLYGEDDKNLYENMSGRAMAFPKNKIHQCPEFDPLNYETWCSQFVTN